MGAGFCPCLTQDYSARSLLELSALGDTFIALWVCICASFLCLHSAGSGAVLFTHRADAGQGKLGFSAGVLWPLSTCSSTNNDISHDLELMHSNAWVSFQQIIYGAEVLLKQLEWEGDSHSFRTFHSLKGSLVLYQIGKQIEIHRGFWTLDIQNLQTPVNPSHLSFCINISEWFLIPQRRSWTHVGEMSDMRKVSNLFCLLTSQYRFACWRCRWLELSNTLALWMVNAMCLWWDGYANCCHTYPAAVFCWADCFRSAHWIEYLKTLLSRNMQTIIPARARKELL